MADTVAVEIVLATPERQLLLSLEVDRGTTVGEVIAQSSIAGKFPRLPVADLEVGVWGKPVSRDFIVRDGDRIELYRPLEIDPREARRRLARAGRTMGRSRQK